MINTELKNLHSHTQFCDGRSSMEDIVRAAVDKGFTTWGFTPHAPLHFPSPCNMKLEDVENYKQEIERLRGVYPQINLLMGMEVDFIDNEHGPNDATVKSYGLDYVIGSVHFIPNQEGIYYDIDGSPERFKRLVGKEFHDDIDYVVRTFWLQTQRMIANGGFDIIGHIDKIALNASSIIPDIEKSEEYRNLADTTIGMAIDAGLAVEINTKHFDRYSRFFPHPRYWKRLVDSKIDLPINSDAHHVDTIASGMDEARKILSSIN